MSQRAQCLDALEDGADLIWVLLLELGEKEREGNDGHLEPGTG